MTVRQKSDRLPKNMGEDTARLAWKFGEYNPRQESSNDKRLIDTCGKIKSCMNLAARCVFKDDVKWISNSRLDSKKNPVN